MSLAELIPAVRSLSRADKVKLKHILDAELSARESPDSLATEAAQDEKLFRQFAAAAALYEPPVEITAEGLRVLEQLLAEARTQGPLGR